MRGRLAGRRALVTGGSRGIGYHVAATFAAQGADVVIAATDADKLSAAQNALARDGHRVAVEAIDVADREACFSLIERAVTRAGGLEILVNCAALYIPKPFGEYTHEEFLRILAVNLHGPFHLMQAALPTMVEAGYGKIVNIASTAGKWGSLNQSAYNASKHGLIGLTRCVALETAAHGITVNALCPGMVDTDLGKGFSDQHSEITGIAPQDIRAGLLKRIPIGRFLQPSECAHLAVYLASAESDGMTGQSILLDGGMLLV